MKHALAVTVEPFKFSPAEPVAYELSYKYSCPKDEMYYIKWVLFIFRGPI